MALFERLSGLVLRVEVVLADFSRHQLSILRHFNSFQE
jgi:hypothetical protein